MSHTQDINRPYISHHSDRVFINVSLFLVVTLSCQIKSP